VGRLLLLFVVLPAVELALLIRLGGLIGTLPTLALIAVTGVVGASLARHQGLGVLKKLQEESVAGRMPAGSLVDGVLILIAAALLVTPGVLTDVFGFLCLVPAFRQQLKQAGLRHFERAVAEGRVQMHVYDERFDLREERVVHDLRHEPREEKVVRDLRDEPRSEKVVRDLREPRDDP